mmetsp:Transcript_39932/g.105507  ORF Transcript_39932/g.105507 Transcript_39932/m.105507 type:complete len:185 (-) Transcript_39932:290-844(-)|eukprot:CAMPEP_0115860932 /NCGR_PEP_ID=MMETSP0287-20121206/17386_1 /TAXON_ID=412157 /ORGANISM="Chrysochromulina rotalis, Strain UIO044" /LENGTH=184 /DNA_ID=CAMNT_0003315279 /DNA_START=15 /DNA_END=569 /DNA_ORIENTATION=+
MVSTRSKASPTRSRIAELMPTPTPAAKPTNSATTAPQMYAVLKPMIDKVYAHKAYAFAVTQIGLLSSLLMMAQEFSKSQLAIKIEEDSSWTNTILEPVLTYFPAAKEYLPESVLREVAAAPNVSSSLHTVIDYATYLLMVIIVLVSIMPVIKPVVTANVAKTPAKTPGKMVSKTPAKTPKSRAK